MPQAVESVLQLARMYGVQTEYFDATGAMQQSTPQGLLRILQALGAPLDTPDDAGDAVRDRNQWQWRRGLEPVAVAWDGICRPLSLRLDESRMTGGSCLCTLELEDGSRQEWWTDLSRLPLTATSRVEGVHYTVRRFSLADRPALPLGYHRLRLELSGAQFETLLVSAPEKAFHSPEDARQPIWGVFAPLYGLRSERSWGSGDFSDLQSLVSLVEDRGGGFVATLPLLASFLEEPFEASPYSPASRLFWNDFYLDVDQVLRLIDAPAARNLMAAADFQASLAALRGSELVDYRSEMALKRRVLEEVAKAFFASSTSHADSALGRRYHEFLSRRPRLQDYAAFRAVCDRRRASWHTWPDRLKAGQLEPGDYDAADAQYHLLVQWLADEALTSLANEAGRSGPGLYLDLPVGVNSDSYDVWRMRHLFGKQVSVGAPPDPVFPKGQDWGFPPLDPEAIRQDGYQYVRSFLGHHMRVAGVLRVDHMMGVSRLFWVPWGLEATHGAYVRYRAEEFYAVFCLESVRHRTLLVGEDLGTVPPEVPAAMQRHQIKRMYVLQYEARPDPDAALPEVFSDAVASANTHDMPPFAAFWTGADIDDRREAGILDENQAATAHAQRHALRQAILQTLEAEGLEHDAPLSAIFAACQRHLARGQAGIVLMNLEDLWGETAPQNLPGTSHDRPNWRRKLRYSIEEIFSRPEWRDMLAEFDRQVKQPQHEAAASG